MSQGFEDASDINDELRQSLENHPVIQGLRAVKASPEVTHAAAGVLVRNTIDAILAVEPHE